MTTEGTTDAGGTHSFALPPRQPTFLARYSRRSKLTTTIFSLTGLFSVFFLLGHIISENDIAQASKRHRSKVHSADHQEQHATSTNGQTPNSAPSTDTKTSVEVINQQDDRSVPMAAAPDPDLTENTPQGDLPRISEDGRQPWQAYARPFNGSDKRPRLAIIVADLGMSRGVTDAAVSRLPANVTFALDVQSPTIGAWSGRVRQEGHEILLSVPMEPFDFPRSDPGPHTLLTSISNGENLEKLNWALRQGTGYVGITTTTGSSFTTNAEKLKLVMQNMHDRGLMVLDARVAPHSAMSDLAHDMHVPVATVNYRIDDNLSPEAIDASFQELEKTARLNGVAVGIVAPLPIIIDHLQAWLKTLPSQGIALAPVSAVVQ